VWVYIAFIPAVIITVAGVVLGGWLEFMVMIGLSRTVCLSLSLSLPNPNLH
jgi:hypothetical protein